MVFVFLLFVDTTAGLTLRSYPSILATEEVMCSVTSGATAKCIRVGTEQQARSRSARSRLMETEWLTMSPHAALATMQAISRFHRRHRGFKVNG